MENSILNISNNSGFSLDSSRRSISLGGIDMQRCAVVDAEVGLRDHVIHDIGSLRGDGAVFHEASKTGLLSFLEGVEYVCGHNIIHHDAHYLFSGVAINWKLVDTLYVSPLLFPERPYHRLLKDDKIDTDQLNNPVNDCKKAKTLLLDEIQSWLGLSQEMKLIYSSLLMDKSEFSGFFSLVNAVSVSKDVLPALIIHQFSGRVCAHADLQDLVESFPCELAYALALISTTDQRSVTPGWVLRNYPNVEYVVKKLRHSPCSEGCDYCKRLLDVHYNLQLLFGYQHFRLFEGENLQERAARAAVEGKSLLAIFPTGGGKSLTFQLPAMMAGRAQHGLTVVISPLQSLMKDQVDNLEKRGVTDVVTINGMLDPISRSLAIDRVKNGEASILYIAPEMLRSKTIERILMVRNVVRFVVDEAHCFSAWGQDFRVDYLYIGKFIRQYLEKKGGQNIIPVSCFTATAKQKVIQDICDYFKQTLGLHLELFASKATRTNLHYSVIHVDTDADKYVKLRSLLLSFQCPAIVYVARTKRTEELARKLCSDGCAALPFHGKMEPDEKIANQEAFMHDRVRVIVATSAFGMGVDKSDVGLVVHYDISNSLENYVQEAGRAGRDPGLEAQCYVLYSDDDLDKHFFLLNQTKLSISEIQQVWSAVKFLTGKRKSVCCSALEIARQAGWDESVYDIETRVRTALAALEQSGYIERGTNVPHVYATGITVRNVDEARRRLTDSILFDDKETEMAIRIIKSLISQKYVAQAQDREAESRVDYLADTLGLTKREVVSAVERMRLDGILADSMDMSAFMQDAPTEERRSFNLLDNFAMLERFILEQIPDSSLQISYKQLNDNALKADVKRSTEKNVRTLLYFLSVMGYVKKKEDASHSLVITRVSDLDTTMSRFHRRIQVCRFILQRLYAKLKEIPEQFRKDNAVQFSVVEMLKQLTSGPTTLFGELKDLHIEDVEEALLYLSRINSIKLEGGFMVIYSAMKIKKLRDNRIRYKQEDYRTLDEFYRQKIQQVHIVGEYANLMVRNYDAALGFVKDYFQLDYKKFLAKYFKEERLVEMSRNMSPERYEKLFGGLSDCQKDIINDSKSRCIVVAAGPGSGKTRVLVHKLASLMQLEDVKHEQLLMLTFSRAAATEFKQRLLQLAGNSAHYVEIKTFHSYCFDLLGRIGNLDEVENVVAQAVEMINNGEVEPNKIRKTVLVIDEAQDMSADEYRLVEALVKSNDDLRLIAVGDDDQNIFEFRGSDSSYFNHLRDIEGGRFVEMTENFRSSRRVVACANQFTHYIVNRLKHKPIVAIRDVEGHVSVTRHVSRFMYAPLVNDFLSHLNAGKNEGTTGILTQTNEEAVMVVGLLRKHGVRCKLVQSLEGMRFCNLAEIKYFMKCLSQNNPGPLIKDERWNNAKADTFDNYKTSTCLSYINRCVELFEKTNKQKYFSDFREFVFESQIDDFCDVSEADVVVSTIHKAKGREFDNVYMLIRGGYQADSILMRQYYVGMTRARNNLYIHTDTKLFDRIGADSITDDDKDYSMPVEVVLQLTHRDVFLEYAKDMKKEVLSLRSGDTLFFRNDVFYNPKTDKPVAKISNKMKKTLSEWENKGYTVASASVRFVVAWKSKEAPKEDSELAVLLPDIHLSL